MGVVKDCLGLVGTYDEGETGEGARGEVGTANMCWVNPPECFAEVGEGEGEGGAFLEGEGRVVQLAESLGSR
jgi:hypothetical protein